MSRLGRALAWLAVAAGVGGCWSGSGKPTPPAQPFLGIKLTVGAVGDTAIVAAVAPQCGEWTAAHGTELTFLEKPVDPRSSEGADVFLFRGDVMGSLIDIGALAVIPESRVQPPPPPEKEDSAEEPRPEPPADSFQFSDVVTAYRDQVTKYGNERVALPLGGSALVLAYHRDGFERAENRAAAKEAKVSLEPPKTWESLDSLAKFFQDRDWDGDGKPDHGIALALGDDPEGVADATYLARAASVGQHRDQYSFLFNSDSMEPRIASPPFVEALQGMARLASSGPPQMAKFDAAAARRAFAEKRTALLIDRAERVADWGRGKGIGVAALPGSGRVYNPLNQVWDKASPLNRPSYLPFGGGWLVGVSRRLSGAKLDAAIDFAKYLTSPETSGPIRRDRSVPMLPVRSSQLALGVPEPAATPGVDSRQWSDAVSRTLLAERVVPGLRIPGADGYLADLSKGRRSAMNGKPADEALKGVAQAWDERTKKLGPARQVWHYCRSLNSIVTTPEPPER